MQDKQAAGLKASSNWLSALWQDTVYAIRLLMRDRAFTVVALLTLAIGIGANTIVFSVLNGVLLKPLPYKDQNRLLVMSIRDKGGDQRFLGVDDLAGVQKASNSFEYLAIESGQRLTSKTDEPSVSLAKVSPDFLKVFALQPELGRDFTAEDGQLGANLVVLISDQYWKDRFQSDPHVLGKTLTLPDSPPVTIVGVLPAALLDPNGIQEPDEVWATMAFHAETNTFYGSRMFGRLKAGGTLQQAQAELGAIHTLWRKDDGASSEQVKAETLLDSVVQRSATTILIFTGAVLSVLLIVIVNLAGLELARLPKLEGELALRTALGASRWRLMQLMLLKTAIVGICGGILGTATAAVFEKSLVAAMSGIPRKGSIELDATALLVSLTLSCLSALLVAIVPAIRASRLNVRDIIYAAGPAHTPSRSGRLFQNLLTAGETALALVLLIAAGLFINNLRLLMSHDLGFNPHGITTLQVTLPTSYEPARQQTFFLDLLRRFQSMSTTDSAALTDYAPINGGSYTGITALEGAPARSRGVNTISVSATYFSTMHIPVIAGRSFSDAEIRDAKPVALVSVSVAGSVWPGETPIGRQFQQNKNTYTVIGIVSDAQYGYYFNAQLWAAAPTVRAASLTSERYSVYFPVTQALQRGTYPPRSATLLVRTSSRTAGLSAVARDMEPKATLKLSAIDEYIGQRTAEQRFQTTVLASFSLVAVLLAAIGIYGVVAHSVVRRTREIGIRMAIGAEPGDVFMQVCRESFVAGAIGLVSGFAGSLAVSRILSSYLYSLQANDGPTYIVVIAVMAVVIVTACAIPARRAARMNPIQALRSE